MSSCLQNRFVISKSKLIGYIIIYFAINNDREEYEKL